MKINISEISKLLFSPHLPRKNAYSKPSSPTQIITQMWTLVLSPGRRQSEDRNQWQEVGREDLSLTPVCTTKTTVYNSHLNTTVYFPFVEPPYCELLLKTIGYNAK